MYEYRATVVKVVDGDTVDLNIDLGFDVSHEQRVRMLGYDAPEPRGATKAAGQASTAFLRELLPVGQETIINTVKDRRDKYGRYLATIYIEGQTMTVNDLMVSEGHGKPMDSDGHPIGKAGR